MSRLTVVVLGVSLLLATESVTAQEPCPAVAWIFWEETATKRAGTTLWQVSDWTVSSQIFESRDACLEVRKNVWKFAHDEWKAKERANRLGIGMVEMVLGNESAADILVSYRDGGGFKLVLYCLPSSLDPRPRR